MKNIIKVAPYGILAVSMVFFGLSIVNTARGAGAAGDGEQFTCPEGTYQIGMNVCKSEPSGCPFYENVGEKGCVPPPNIKCSDDTFRNCWSVDIPTETTTKPEPTTTTPTAPVTTPKPTVPACKEATK